MAKESTRTKTPARRTRSTGKPPTLTLATSFTATSFTKHDDIARRAFEIYVSRGASEGNALGDWVQAERELTSQSA
ncbi:MAG TPA: DUF2934 domain-containing protein [Polyangiaceae bacterium]|jgi:hypothetical protein|nr:DUF2934 domain-containing protein [Polyangiaceae bacterium]